MLTVEEGMYDLLGVEFNTDNQSGDVTMNQGGLANEVLKTVGMLDSNNKIAPEATMPLVTDADGPPFDEPLEYSSSAGMFIYLSRNSRPNIHFVVHQCARFTHNPRRDHTESVNRICLYLIATQGQGLTFDPNSYMKLDCSVDADFA